MKIEVNNSKKTIEYKDNLGKIKHVCAFFEPVRLYYSLDEDELVDYVEFERYCTTKKDQFMTEISNLSSAISLRTTLINHRIYYREIYNDIISEYVTDRIEGLRIKKRITYNTKKLGWNEVDDSGTLEFILAPKKIENLGRVEYFDKQLNFTCGSLKGQMKFLKNEVLPYKESTFGLVLGLASIISSYLEKEINIGTLVVNITGKSTTGKSTIVDLIASMYGDPQSSNYGLVRTFNATKNFIFSMSEGRNGVPIILDDSNANPKEHSKSDLIYQFALGEPRGRCNSNGSTQAKRSGWSGITIITSEDPILESENMSHGATVRTLTLQNILWTKDAPHSNRIKSGATKNYGYIAPLVAEVVKSYGLKELLNRYHYYEEKIVNMMVNKDHFSSRMASKVASIPLCGEILNTIFKEYYEEQNDLININQIIEILINADQQGMISRSKDDYAYEELENYISINKSKFKILTHIDNLKVKGTEEKVMRQEPFKSQFYGEIHIREDEAEVYITSTILDDLMKKKGFREKNTIFQCWENKGLMFRGQKDRYVFKKKKGISIAGTYYKLKLRDFTGYIPNTYDYIVDNENICENFIIDKDDVKQIENEMSIKVESVNNKNNIKVAVSDYNIDDSDLIQNFLESRE